MPYMGGKRKLSKQIVDHILESHPNTTYVYDLFGGGGAISLEFAQRQQIETVFYNDLNAGVVALFEKILRDGVTQEMYQWVSRETFFAHKNDDDWFGGLCKIIWSFGNNQSSYMFPPDIEPYKKAFHELVVEGVDTLAYMSQFCNDYVKSKYGVDEELVLELPAGNTINERRLNMRQQLRSFEKRCRNVQQLEQLQQLRQLRQLEQLQQLEQLERLQQLQQLERLERLNLDGKIKFSNQSAFGIILNTPIDKTIVYLDPPYKGTTKYQEMVCYDELSRFIASTPYIVYMSGYESDNMNCVLEMPHNTALAKARNTPVVEKLFCNREIEIPPMIKSRNEFFGV